MYTWIFFYAQIYFEPEMCKVQCGAKRLECLAFQESIAVVKFLYKPQDILFGQQKEPKKIQ